MALFPRARTWAAFDFVCVLSALLLIPNASAAAINATIDDSDTDFFHYVPFDAWFPNSQCSNCAISNSTFDQSQIGQRTWHDTTAQATSPPLSVSFSFNGVLKLSTL
jgi:hypothetical protein